MTQKITSPSAREAAYLALLSCQRDNTFLSKYLDQWSEDYSPSSLDFSLAQEIAYGTERQKISLDYLAKKLSQTGKLSLKSKEKILLRTALYQFYYMDRVPLYALANESVTIARKYCHSNFVKFLNAVLRKLPDTPSSLPQGNSVADLSINFSFPEFFISHLLEDYGLEKSIEIMQTSNSPIPTTVRVRSKEIEHPELSMFVNSPFPFVKLTNKSLLPEISKSSNYYIQNVTPATLLGKLCEKIDAPEKVLDLCASPGGKTIAIHDYFPKAELFANDISENKLLKLNENFQKYDIDAHISISNGESFQSDELFDIIIVDAPCSNSGVLNKRPEARWRLSDQSIKSLEELQAGIIENAIKFLKDGGQLWYMTCSILKSENEKAVERFSQDFGLQIVRCETILPNKNGWDGGFSCAFTKTKLTSL
ncbi:MAG: 16S rRNA (cytosine967-C5)-methyltransferase [Chlamydiales bacterium]|jgi:16S rRNA (cytosine967-C5)-methyltransferase